MIPVVIGDRARGVRDRDARHRLLDRDREDGGWLLGPFESAQLWQPWTFRALGGADWSAVLEQAAGIATAVFVAAIAILFNISGTEVVLHRDLDTNQELRDAGVLNVISGALGGIPGYHALSLTSLGSQMASTRGPPGSSRRSFPSPPWCSAPE